MVLRISGIVHGQTIQLTEPLGLADGEHVELTVTTNGSSRTSVDGIQSTAGAWADVTEADRVFAEIALARRADS